jgi:uncharacterized membrane protein
MDLSPGLINELPSGTRGGRLCLLGGKRVKNNRYLASYTPGVVAAVQAAHIHPSTAGRRLVKLAEQAADAVRKGAYGVREARHQDRSAVAGIGPPLSTDIHFWTAAPRIITASTIITVVQMVRIHPSMLRAVLAPIASG